MNSSQRNAIRVIIMCISTLAGVVSSYYAAQHFMNGEMFQAFGSLVIAIICGQQIIGRLEKME